MAGNIEIGSFRLSWGAQKSSTGPGEGYTYDLKGTEAVKNFLGHEDNFSEERVSERRAHGLATAYTCINVRGRTVSSLPIDSILNEDGSKRVVTDTAASYVLHNPNRYLSSANLFLTAMIHADSWGNAIIGINRDSRARPSSLDIIPPGEWSVTTSEGDAWYRINGETYSSQDVLHFRWFSYDGLNGISPIRLNAMTFGKAFKENRYSTMSLGQRPPGMLTYEGNLNPQQQAQNQKSWKEDLAAGRTPVLGGKMDYRAFMIPPGDAEYIETAKLTDRKICGIFQTPPSMTQDYSDMHYAVAEQTDLVYAKHTITPIVTNIEKECNMKLYSEKEKKTLSTKMNMNGLLRGDSAARAAFYTAMRNIGGLNGDEIRALEDMNAYEGGDIFTVQGAMVPVDQLREFYATKMMPKEEPPTEPAKEQNTTSKVNGHQYAFN